LGKYWDVLTTLNFSQIYLYLGHDLPKDGKILGKELMAFNYWVNENIRKDWDIPLLT